jgi:hypothetical protein
VVDPACGCGFFLIVAYERLLAWHLKHYERDPESFATGPARRIVRGDAGRWSLMFAEKVRILEASVFGVDLDPLAIEVARLSLLLTALVGEPARAGDGTGSWAVDDSSFKSLGKNLRHGNSILGEDLPTGAHDGVGPQEDLTPFAWERAFEGVFSRENPGFDVVLGNPPYVDSEWMTSHRPATRAYCARTYAAASGNWDLYCVFIERSLQILRRGGRHGFIVPNKLASAAYAGAARRLLCTEVHLQKIRDYSEVPVFSASVYPLIYAVERPQPGIDAPEFVIFERVELDGDRLAVRERREIEYARLCGSPERGWPIFGSASARELLSRLIDDHPALRTVARVWGAATVAEAYELLPLLTSRPAPAREDLRVLNSGTIDPHRPLWGEKPMRYLKQSFSHPVVPRDRQVDLPPTRLEQARTPKLIVAGMTRGLECVADVNGEFLAAKSTTIVLPEAGMKLGLLAAVLNSRLMTQIYEVMFGGLSLQGGYLRVGPPQLGALPICRSLFDPRSPQVVVLEKCVARLDENTRGLARASSVEGAKRLERDRVEIERARDRAVCALYGLGEVQSTNLLSGARPA